MKKRVYLLMSCWCLIGLCTASYAQLPIQVTEHKTTHLIMPDEIEYTDLGDGENYGFEYDKNILRIKGQKTEHRTNLTVITRNKDYYSFTLIWQENPSKLNYFITPYERVRSIQAFKPTKKEPEEPTILKTPVKEELKINEPPKVVLVKKSVADLELENMLYEKAKRIRNKPLLWQHVGKKFTNIELRVGSIYHDLHHCYIVYEIKNHSAIPYDLSYIELGIKDKKRAKKSAYNETILEERLQLNNEKRILPFRTNRYVAVYDKLAIPNGKMLYMEIVEAGRNLSLNIPYNKLKILTL